MHDDLEGCAAVSEEPESHHMAVTDAFRCPHACKPGSHFTASLSDVAAPFNDELFAACAGASVGAVIALKSCNPITFDSFSLGRVVLCRP